MNLTVQNTKLIEDDFTWSWMMHDTNVSNATVMKFANNVSKSAATFIAKLNSHPAVPRSFTVELIHDIGDIMSHNETLKEACSSLPESSLNLLNMFDIHRLQNWTSITELFLKYENFYYA